jgi:hypothetical protein
VSELGVRRPDLHGTRERFLGLGSRRGLRLRLHAELGLGFGRDRLELLGSRRAQLDGLGNRLG